MSSVLNRLPALHTMTAPMTFVQLCCTLLWAVARNRIASTGKLYATCLYAHVRQLGVVTVGDTVTPSYVVRSFFLILFQLYMQAARLYVWLPATPEMSGEPFEFVDAVDDVEQQVSMQPCRFLSFPLAVNSRMHRALHTWQPMPCQLWNWHVLERSSPGLASNHCLLNAIWQQLSSALHEIVDSAACLIIL